ncbi:ROK family transcriptional regulator [Rhizobium sp. VS19-DR104.2]|uniref:ROK family transcriptional regulator n=1 Tax=unclassified Rhizobium TaxID=2613769 RepID=UPI001C5ADAC0|nr:MULTISPECIES: ROK family transcriptional regulator [unclassified Rhizobium]MBZ5763251.1 ROK family transcriptional regulator [Rhizobium sp. VS19-DR96]MBZ5769151.1 ROK family transcriptional regulator [Rhizobium sp. VS19-DR129.2]MBZ5776721.1 ROK family transcriptional regulator [Rhizobium sp. VS19-DRK62.2]MBZ5787838.1 ROK family transcriptional regulator [Rhizobium sp. VS19-DR121]MBZ5805233.1 ROK family transcriptional regulator [Rhizobium sp. VS19-DR181]
MNDIASPGSSPRRIRQTNVAAALRSLYTFGCMSRADLARRLGLNRSSSGQIVVELTESGFVHEVEESSDRKGEQSRAGRPGILLELVPDAAFFFGIEIGVEHIAAVIIDLCGQVHSFRTQAFDAPSRSVEQAVRQAFELALGDIEGKVLQRCRGLGLSAPAHVDAHGFVSLAPIIGWRNVPLSQIAKAAFPFDVPIIIENDANAFAIGDSYKHGHSGVTLFLLMETGVGGGVLVDGKLFRGGHGLAGEIGHTLVPGSGGQRFEQLIGREALVSQYRLAKGDGTVDLAEFLDDVRDRVPAAVTIAETWSRHLALALTQACRLLDPNRIVLGGSVASLYPMVSARVAVYMAEGQEIAFPAPQIVVDEDAELGSAFGAACLLHQRFLSLESDTFAGEDTTQIGAAGGEAPPPTNDERQRT